MRSMPQFAKAAEERKGRAVLSYLLPISPSAHLTICLFFALLVLCPRVASATGTWTLVQAVEGQPSNEASTCGTGTATTCVIPLSQTTTAGNLLVFYGFASNNVTISSISAGSGSTGTFTHCSNCAQWNSTVGASEDGGYVLSAGAASTSITVTFSGATGQASIYMWEFHWSGTSFSFDVSNSSQGSCSDHSLTGQALTLNGSSDAIVQVENFDHGQASAISSPYTIDSSTIAVGFAYGLNMSSGSAPTWTTTGNNATTCESGAIAIQGKSGNAYTATPSETNTASDSLGVVHNSQHLVGMSETNTASDALAAAVNGWDYLQEVTNDGCTVSATTCTLAWPSATTVGSTIMVAMGGKGWTTAPTIASVWMCTSNPCTSDSSGGTWQTGLSGSPWSITGGSPTHSVDLGYETSNSGGLTYITITRTSPTVTWWGLTAIEVKWTGTGSVSLDAIGNPGGGSNSCTSCTGSSFSSLVGSHDALLQELDVDNTPSGASSPYFVTTNPKQWMIALGYATTSAPTFTQSPAGQALVPALAFRAGNASYSASESETNTASDSLARLAGWLRGESETNTASDTLGRLGNFLRGDAESNAASDSLARLATWLRGDSETNTASDALARLGNFGRSDSETNTASDISPARILAAQRGDAETNTASDSITGSHGMYPVMSESHTASDSVGRRAVFGRGESETNVAGDALGRLVAWLRGDSETNTALDALSALHNGTGTHNAVMTEILTLSDALTRLGAFGRSDNEMNTASDSLGRSARFVRVESEANVAVDGLARLAVWLRSNNESLAFSDLVVGTRNGRIVVLPRHAGTVPAKTKGGTVPTH